MAKQTTPPVDASTEQTILAVAEQLFLEKGFGLASTTEIARRAGCNQALVHYYFRTKEQLFERIFEGKVGLFIDRFLGACREGTTFEEKITGIIDVHYDILGENPRLPHLIINELATNPARIEKLRDRVSAQPMSFIQQLGGELEKEIAAGRVRPMELQDLLFDLLSLDVMPFFVSPILKPVLGLDEAGYKKFIARRRETAKQTMINSLRP